MTIPAVTSDPIAVINLPTVLADLSTRLVHARTFDEAAYDVVRTVADALDVEMCGFLETGLDPGTFIMRAGVGMPGMAGGTVPAGRDSAVSYVVRTRRAIAYSDLAADPRFSPPPRLVELGVRSGMGVPVIGDAFYGVLGVHSTHPRTFTAGGMTFARTAAALLAGAITRARITDDLRSRQHLYGKLAARAHDMIFRIVFDPAPRFESVNPAAERMLGYDVATLLSGPSLTTSTVHHDDRHLLFAPSKDDMQTQVRFVARDGITVWCDVSIVATRDPRGTLVCVDGVAHNMTEQVVETDLLRRAFERERAIADELRSLDTMKNAFLQAVSHELRTPLTSVLGMSMILRDRLDQLSPADRADLLERLGSNAERLERLLRDLLDLDRLMRSAIVPERRQTDMRALVEATLEQVDLGAREVSLTAAIGEARLDAPKVERIVENLLINAARHTPPTARIWIDIESAGDGVLLTVSDDGPGIPREIRGTIFQPFERGPSDHEHAPGTGIGLSLVARFAELHGGRAWVEERPGGGARFRVLLPSGNVLFWTG